MVPWRTALILLLVASGDAALLNRVAQRLSARRVRDALIAPVISDAPTPAEPERVETRWRRVLEAGRELRVDTYWRRDDSELSQRLARMLEATPSLLRPTYRPTTWAKGSKANFALAFARSRAGELRRKARSLRAANLHRCPHTSARAALAHSRSRQASRPPGRAPAERRRRPALQRLRRRARHCGGVGEGRGGGRPAPGRTPILTPSP